MHSGVIRSALPRICFLGYRQIREFALPVLAEYEGRAEIEVVDGAFDRAVSLAKERIQSGQVDAFVSAGSNAQLLRASIDAPVAAIQLTGFDIFQALLKARRISRRVGVVMYGQTIPELEAVKNLLNIEVTQYAYQTPEDASSQFELLRASGFEVIVGSSLVVELAQQAGLQGMLAYSLAGVRKGLDDAIELARVSRLESGRYEQLNGVLRTLREAVLAVGADNRIVAANPPMQQLLARPLEALLGQFAHEVEPQFSLQSTLDTGAHDQGIVLRFDSRDWVASRVPILERGEVVGAALTLYEAGAIHEADSKLRIQQRKRQVMARHSFTSIVGQSSSLTLALATARRFSRTDLTVLIVGESGVGKELFAQSIHNDSGRAGRPFVAVNCAAFPESLLESELFGYEEGAFTGSRRGGKRGVFESAHTGTLFLDEIGDMPLHLQTRLLRVLQEREITRLGATVAVPVDVRVIAATHQSLQDLIETKRFRHDLYYRINTLRLRIPPLRERKTDIGVLSQALLARCLSRNGSRLNAARALAPLLPWFEAYPWPGNVRELENIVERLAVSVLDVAAESQIDYDIIRGDCPEIFNAQLIPPKAQEAVVSQSERVAAAMKEAHGNRQKAARILGISRSTLWRWLATQEQTE